MPVLVQPEVYQKAAAPRSHTAGATDTQVLTGIVTASRFFRLSKPIRVIERRRNGVWTCDCRRLQIHAYGQTLQEAWRAFIEIFECDWDSVALEKDSKLTMGARQLKQKYLEVVEAVEAVL